MFGVEVDQTQLDSAMKKTDRFLGMLQGGVRVAKAFGAALAGNALVGFISQTVEAADDIGDMAARLGIATDQFQILKAVAEDAGTSVGAIQGAFRNVANEVQSGAKEFGKLGISIRDAGGHQKTTSDLFWEAGDAIGGIEDSNKRLAVAQKLFGRSALDLIPIFTAEKGSLDELKEAAVVFSDEFIQSADRVSKRQKILTMQWEKLKGIIVSQLLPAFEWLVQKVSKITMAVVKWAKSGNAMSLMIAGLIVAIPALVAALAPLAAEFLAVALPIAALVLGLDDLITFIRGGDSLIGRFLAKVFGEDAKENTSKFLKTIFDAVWELVKFLTGDTSWDKFVEQFETATMAVRKVIDGLVGYINGAIDQVALHMAQKLKGVFGAKIGSFIFGEDVEKTRENTDKADTVLSGGHFGPKGFDPLNMPLTVPSIAPPPSTTGIASAQRAAGAVTTINDQSDHSTTVNVQGVATPETARQIGREVSRVSTGRDRAAIGSAMGVVP